MSGLDLDQLTRTMCFWCKNKQGRFKMGIGPWKVIHHSHNLIGLKIVVHLAEVYKLYRTNYISFNNYLSGESFCTQLVWTSKKPFCSRWENTVPCQSYKITKQRKISKFGLFRIDKWICGDWTLHEGWTSITWIWVSSRISWPGARGRRVRSWCSWVRCCWSSAGRWIRHPSWSRGWWVPTGVTPGVRPCTRGRSVRFDRIRCLRTWSGWVCRRGVPWRGYVRWLYVRWRRISWSSCES